MMIEINVQTLKEMFDNSEEFILLDVRENAEVSAAKIEKSIHIPMNELPRRLGELDKDKRIVAMCHTGMRSAQVCMYLKTQGFNMMNLFGGIDSWAKEIDKNIVIY